MFEITLERIPADGLATNDWVANAFRADDDTVSIASASGDNPAQILSEIGEYLATIN